MTEKHRHLEQLILHTTGLNVDVHSIIMKYAILCPTRKYVVPEVGNTALCFYKRNIFYRYNNTKWISLLNDEQFEAEGLLHAGWKNLYSGRWIVDAKYHSQQLQIEILEGWVHVDCPTGRSLSFRTESGYLVANAFLWKGNELLFSRNGLPSIWRIHEKTTATPLPNINTRAWYSWCVWKGFVVAVGASMKLTFFDLETQQTFEVLCDVDFASRFNVLLPVDNSLYMAAGNIVYCFTSDSCL